MYKQEKPPKSGFVIKLSSETLQKLQDNESTGPEELPSSPGITKTESGTSAEFMSTVRSTVVRVVEVLNEPKVETKNDKKLGDTDNTNAANTEPSWGEYAPYITYEGEIAVYTDPTTKVQYIWNTESNSWETRNPEALLSQQSGSAPQDPERTYSYENDTHVYTEADGSKFFWDEDKKAWFPKVDDDFLAHYQMSYGFVDNTTKKEETSEQPKKDPEAKKVQGPMKRKAPEEAKWFDASEDKSNTKVYVSNLPDDLTEEEFVDLMQKCGLVMREPSNQKMKVKLYYDKESNCFKGDALCTYIKIESVELALNLLDGSDVRGRKISVQRAQFQMKGDYNPALKPKKKKKKELEKLKRMQQKLFDWRPEKAVGEHSKNERVVIVKNLFDPSDFDKEVQLILDYQQDLREECGKCGEVRKVVLYDRHPEGVAQITMKEPEQADAAVLLINGRWFGKRKLSAEIWDGRTKYRIAETDADMNQRVNKWEKFLEGEPEKKDENEKKVEGVKGESDKVVESDTKIECEKNNCPLSEVKDVKNEDMIEGGEGGDGKGETKSLSVKSDDSECDGKDENDNDSTTEASDEEDRSSPDKLDKKIPEAMDNNVLK